METFLPPRGEAGIFPRPPTVVPGLARYGTGLLALSLIA
jgi:hypothetical protein